MAKKKKKKNIKNGKKNKSFIKSFFELGVFILFVLLMTYVLVNFVVQKTIVHNVSMNNTLFEGDNILMDKVSYAIGEPERFDVICFKSYSEKDLLIKRIIGLPGERVRILAGTIYINDEPITDIKGLDKPDNPGRASETITLSDDEYFVLGDNRVESIDSRYSEVGDVRRKDILGKATCVIYPFNRIKKIK